MANCVWRVIAAHHAAQGWTILGTPQCPVRASSRGSVCPACVASLSCSVNRTLLQSSGSAGLPARKKCPIANENTVGDYAAPAEEAQAAAARAAELEAEVARLQGLAAQLEDDLAAASAAPGSSGPAAKQPGADVAAAAGDVLAAAAGEPIGCKARCSFKPIRPRPAFASAQHGSAASCQQAVAC